MGIHISGIGDEKVFAERWPHVDVSMWPGRELCWIWTHPTAGLVLILTALWEIALIIRTII